MQNCNAFFLIANLWPDFDRYLILGAWTLNDNGL